MSSASVPVLLPSACRIAHDTRGAVQPSFVLLPRPITDVAPGDLMVEPVLGEVRVVHVCDFDYDEVAHRPLRQVHWVSDDGLSTAARTFDPATVVAVRAPAPADAHAVRRAIDRAIRCAHEVDLRTARLIAAHLQRGPGSALYAFAVSMAVTERLYDELDEIRPARSPNIDRWIDALANHCLNRTDHRRHVRTGSVHDVGARLRPATDRGSFPRGAEPCPRAVGS